MRIIKGICYYIAGFLLVFTFVNFLIWILPGRLADVLSDSETNLIDLKRLAALNDQSGSFLQRLFDFVTLNWHESILYRENNLPLIFRHLKVTLLVASLSLLFSFGFLYLFFVIGRKKKYLSRYFANFLLAVPALAFFPATVFALCKYTDVCPAGSSNMFLLVTCAAIAQAILISPRFYRELEWEIENTLRQRFVLVLRAKGLATKRILWVHVLTNVLAPFLSLVLLTWLGFLGGSILLEALFDIPGVGALTLEALKGRDIPLIFSLVMCLSMLHLSTLQLSRMRQRLRDE